MLYILNHDDGLTLAIFPSACAFEFLKRKRGEAQNNADRHRKFNLDQCDSPKALDLTI